MGKKTSRQHAYRPRIIALTCSPRFVIGQWLDAGSGADVGVGLQEVLQFGVVIHHMIFRESVGGVTQPDHPTAARTGAR